MQDWECRLILDENRQAVIGRSDNLDQKLATLRYLLQDSNTVHVYGSTTVNTILSMSRLY